MLMCADANYEANDRPRPHTRRTRTHAHTHISTNEPAYETHAQPHKRTRAQRIRAQKQRTLTGIQKSGAHACERMLMHTQARAPMHAQTHTCHTRTPRAHPSMHSRAHVRELADTRMCTHVRAYPNHLNAQRGARAYAQAHSHTL
eukprot:5758351-Pleurochrysis_carterae.AAC.2